MCRNIRTLFNFDPPASEEEIRAASLQFVRKVSGFAKPSRANQLAFERAVDEIARSAGTLVRSLVTNSAPRDRALQAARARARTRERFASPDSQPPPRASDRDRDESADHGSGSV